jgi:hypothetical protein
MANKLALKFNQNNFSDFLQKFKDLTNIEDCVKIKITSSNILLYSMISNDVSVLALKTYLLKTDDYIEGFKQDTTFDLIITSATKFAKNLALFNTNSTIKLDLVFKPSPDSEDTMHVRAAQFTNNKLKITIVGGEQHKIRDLNPQFLETRLNPKLSKWSFKISKEDFADVKKLCGINNEERIVNINVTDNKVTMNELSKWELIVDEVDAKNTQLIFGKKYLSNINDQNDNIYFSIFETFILVKDENSNLMLSFEQDFTADDE